MKIRTDFVTNSSSSSFVTVNIKSQALADYLDENMDVEGFAQIEIDDDEITVEAGDRDWFFVANPRALDDVIPSLMKLCELECDEAEMAYLRDSLESVEWQYETMGLDGDDGRWDRSKYAPERLQEILEEIADENDCDPEDVTDKMFNEYVTPEVDDTTEETSFTYDRETGKTRYHYFNWLVGDKEE